MKKTNFADKVNKLFLEPMLKEFDDTEINRGSSNSSAVNLQTQGLGKYANEMKQHRKKYQDQMSEINNQKNIWIDLAIDGMVALTTAFMHNSNIDEILGASDVKKSIYSCKGKLEVNADQDKKEVALLKKCIGKLVNNKDHFLHVILTPG